MNATIKDAFKALEDIKDEVVKPAKHTKLSESKEERNVGAECVGDDHKHCVDCKCKDNHTDKKVEDKEDGEKHTESCKDGKRGKKVEEGKLREGTSNFFTDDNLPLLIFDNYENVESKVYDKAQAELGDDFDGDVRDTEEYEKAWEEIDYCVLDEQEIEDLESDIKDFNYRVEHSDDFDSYDEQAPEVELKPGYYEAYQLWCNTKYLSEKGVQEVSDFYKEMKDKYGLTQLGVSFRFSNGETGYHIIADESVKGKELKNQRRNRMLSVKEAVVNTMDDDAMQKAKDDLEGEEKEQTEKVVDVDAETVDKLKDSYIGNAILQCRVCRTLIYKTPDTLKQDEENKEVWNKDEECPHCGSSDGFELVGQVAEMDVKDKEEEATKETEDEVKVDDKVDTEVTKTEEEGSDVVDTETKDTKEVTVESIDENKFNSVTNKYLKSVYSNVDSFETTSGKVDNDNNKVFVEGVVKFKSGKQMKTKFVFESVSTLEENGDRYIKLQGMNESITKADKPFTLVTKISGKDMLSESLSYDYVVKTKDSKKRVKGKTRA